MGEQVINQMDNQGQNPETPLENAVPAVAAAEEWQKSMMRSKKNCFG